MKRSTIFVVLASAVALSSAATTVNPNTAMSTDIVTEFATTIVDNTTTATQPMSTKIGPTPCADATWMVRQEDGSICMLMSFEGEITYDEDTLNIPETASATDSTCSNDSAEFQLSIPYASKNETWIIGMKFNVDGSRYYLGEASFAIALGKRQVQETVEGEFFFVPVGEHYTCDTLEIPFLTAEVSLTSPVMQPFVQRTTDACGLGGAHQCGAESSKNVGLIVGLTLGGVAVVGLVGGGLYYMRKKRNSYSNIR